MYPEKRTANEVPVELQITANVNEKEFQFSGESRGVFGSGDISAEIDTHDVLPPGFHPSLLSYVILTGQPSMSLVTEGAANPFIESSGVYEAKRSLNLGSRGRLETSYRVEKARKGLRAIFKIEGSVNVPPLVRIEPTIETWVPEGKGKISGNFTMVWLTSDGNRVKGETRTTYVLPTKTTIPGIQFREIRIAINCDGKRLAQSERIIIFTPALLDKMLVRK